MSTPAQPTAQSTFPHHIKISLEIDVLVDKQEGQDYYINTDSTPTIDFIADAFDSLFSATMFSSLYSVNGLTLEDIRKELNKKAGF